MLRKENGKKFITKQFIVEGASWSVDIRLVTEPNTYFFCRLPVTDSYLEDSDANALYKRIEATLKVEQALKWEKIIGVSGGLDQKMGRSWDRNIQPEPTADDTDVGTNLSLHWKVMERTTEKVAILPGSTENPVRTMYRLGPGYRATHYSSITQGVEFPWTQAREDFLRNLSCGLVRMGNRLTSFLDDADLTLRIDNNVGNLLEASNESTVEVEHEDSSKDQAL